MLLVHSGQPAVVCELSRPYIRVLIIVAVGNFIYEILRKTLLAQGRNSLSEGLIGYLGKQKDAQLCVLCTWRRHCPSDVLHRSIYERLPDRLHVHFLECWDGLRRSSMVQSNGDHTRCATYHTVCQVIQQRKQGRQRRRYRSARGHFYYQYGY